MTPAVLLDSSNPEIRLLKVSEIEDGLAIEGQASSFYIKQLAQETLRPYAAGRRIRNRVRVRGTSVRHA